MHPDGTDGLAHAETAFFLSHENLGPDRDDVPDEYVHFSEHFFPPTLPPGSLHSRTRADSEMCRCFAWPTSVPDSKSEDEEAENKGQAKKKRKSKPRARHHGPDPGFWFEDNKILLDPHNNPVRKHLDIPLTLSAHMEGYKMDLIRILNASITQRDLWARSKALF